MPFVEVKKNGKTTFRFVEDLKDYDEKRYQNEEQGDLTTGSASLVSVGISKERFDEIFNKGGERCLKKKKTLIRTNTHLKNL